LVSREGYVFSGGSGFNEKIGRCKSQQIHEAIPSKLQGTKAEKYRINLGERDHLSGLTRYGFLEKAGLQEVSRLMAVRKFLPFFIVKNRWSLNLVGILGASFGICK